MPPREILEGLNPHIIRVLYFRLIANGYSKEEAARTIVRLMELKRGKGSDVGLKDLFSWLFSKPEQPEEIIIIEEPEERHRHKTEFIRIHLGPVIDPVADRSYYHFFHNKHHRHGGRSIMAFQLLDSQKVSVEAHGVDAAGQVTDDGTISFAVSDTSVVALTDNGDGTATLVAGTIGTTTLTASHSNGTNATLDIEVTAGPTTTVVITPGTPSDK